jgi:hypothetical protein
MPLARNSAIRDVAVYFESAEKLDYQAVDS